MNKKKDKFSLVLIMIGALIMGIALYGLVPILYDYYSAEKSYDDLAKNYVKVYNTSVDGTASSKVWYEMAEVDIVSLKNSYPNVVGWIMFENEDISYPIMQTTDNAYYLDKTYNGSRSSAGSIFLDTYNDKDYSDFHSIIYGHNMKNLSMFGKLRYYKTNADYYESHRYFQIFTEDEILRYEIFSYQECPVSSCVFEVEYPSTNSEILKELTRRSMVSSGISVTTEDHIITLSTCTSSDDYRFIVSGVLVERYSLIEKELEEQE